MSKLKTRRPRGSQLQLTKVFLFLTILLAPLYVVRFNVGSYPSTLLEVLVGLTVVSWVFERGGVGEIRGRIREISPAVWLFLVAVAISVVASPDKRGGLGIFKAYFVEPILIYLVIKDVVKSKRDWWLVFGALGLSGLWVATLAVFQGLFGWPIFASHEAALGRAHAVYNTANAVGLYLGPIIFLLLGAVGGLKGIKGAKEIATVGGIGLMVLAILSSKSSGAMVGLAAAASFFILYPLFSRKRLVRVAGVAGIALLLAGLWFFFNISNFTPKNVDPYVRKSADTLQFRLCLWEGARNLLLDNPVFGAGLSGFKELYSQKYFTCDAEPLEYPHNWVLNFWTEMGILGLLAFLGMLWRYSKIVNGQMVKSSHLTMQPFFLAAMVYWLIHGLVDVPYFKNDLALEFWVIVGLAETMKSVF